MQATTRIPNWSLDFRSHPSTAARGGRFWSAPGGSIAGACTELEAASKFVGARDAPFEVALASYAELFWDMFYGHHMSFAKHALRIVVVGYRRSSRKNLAARDD